MRGPRRAARQRRARRWMGRSRVGPGQRVLVGDGERLLQRAHVHGQVVHRELPVVAPQHRRGAGRRDGTSTKPRSVSLDSAEEPVRSWLAASRSASRSSSARERPANVCAVEVSGATSSPPPRLDGQLRLASSASSASRSTRGRELATTGLGRSGRRVLVATAARRQARRPTTTLWRWLGRRTRPGRREGGVPAMPRTPRRTCRCAVVGAASSNQTASRAGRRAGNAGAGGGEHPLGVRDELARAPGRRRAQLRRPGPAPPPGVPGGRALPSRRRCGPGTVRSAPSAR